MEVDGTSDSGHKAMRGADLMKTRLYDQNQNELYTNIPTTAKYGRTVYMLYHCDTIPYAFHETPEMCGNDGRSHLNLVRRNPKA